MLFQSTDKHQKEFIAQLQSLPGELRWAVSDAALIHAIEAGQPVKRGRNGRVLARLYRIASLVRMASVLTFCVGFLAATKIFFRQRNGLPNNLDAQTFPRRWFVGFGAGPEESMFREYCEADSLSVERIDQTDVRTTGNWIQVGYLSLMRELLASLRSAGKAISQLPPEVTPARHQFWVFVSIRIAMYSYHVCWFRKLKEREPTVVEACFVAADTPAFAASHAGWTTRHLQHGLIRQSLLFPDFEYVSALTLDEANHFQSRIPSTRITLRAYDKVDCRNPNKILIASCYGRPERMKLVESFLEYASIQKLDVCVRRHPRQDLDTWNSVCGGAAVRLESDDENLEAAIKRLKPSMVVSWFSTSIADALNFGVIPVTVCSKGDPDVQDLVFPLFRRSLHWPSQRDEIDLVLSDSTAYENTLTRLCSNEP